MPRSALSLVRLLPTSDAAPADMQLLRAFAGSHSDGVFEELVRRYGPMVLATCRRVLGSRDDAEDAFQAVFLVLARKASTVRGNLPGWLYAVSVRTARGVRIMRDRRRKYETLASARLKPEVLADTDHDIAAVIDEELGRLPEHYREAVMLCELRGLSRKQAATELGIPEGTLSSRLAAAKRMLAARLSARGLVAPAALAAALAPATVSAGLVRSAVAAVGGAAGPVVLAAGSAVVKAMLFDQLKAATVAVGILLTVVCGGWAMIATSDGTDPGRVPAPALRLVDDPAVKLVQQLGDPEFATREATGEQLRKLGAKARPALEAAQRDPNPEIAKRARMVLTAIRADLREAFAKQFDPTKTEEYDHPVWKRYVAIAGDSLGSRELFARIIENKKWLRTLDNAEADPVLAGHVYRVGIAEMFRDFHNDPAKSPEWPCDRPEEVAYLLLLGSYPDNNPPAKLTGDEVVPENLRGKEFLGRGIIFGEGQITHANGLSLGLDGKIRFFNAPEIVGAVGTDRVFARLFAAWLARRDPSSEVVPRGLRIAAGQRVPEILPLLRRYAANDFEPKRDIPPITMIAALELVAQLGTRADLSLFERHFGDDTNVAAVDKPRADGAKDYYRPAPVTDTTQLRDVALGLALLLHEANPADFGFVVRKDTFTQKDGRYAIPWSTQLHLGFDSEASRTAAFKKAKAWLAEPKVEPKPGDEPAPTSPPQTRTLDGHNGSVRVAFSNDGKTFAKFRDDTTVLLRDPRTGGVRHRLLGHAHPVTAAAFSPDGKTLATADSKTVRTWDVASGKAGDPLPATFATVQGLAYSPDGKTLANVSENGKVELWAGGKVVRAFASPRPEGVPVVVSSVRFSPDGALLAIASTDGHPGSGHVRLWDPTTGTMARTVLENDRGFPPGVNPGLWGAVFSPDGKLLAVADAPGWVTVFETTDWKKVREMEAEAQIRSIAFAPDSRTLAVGLRRDVQVWDAVEGKRLSTLEGHGNWVGSLTYSPDGVLASGSSDKTAR